MSNKLYGAFVHTAGGADITIATTSVAFMGVTVDGSAGGCSVTLKSSSAGDTICIIRASSLDGKVFSPTHPVAVESGITATASGTGNYAVFYGRQ